MRKLVLATALLTLADAAPANAQVNFGVGPGGVHVGVGHPGYDRDYGWRHRRDAYAWDRGDCRVFRDRIITPSGRVIYRTRRVCD